MLNLHRDIDECKQETARYGEVLGDHRQDGNVIVRWDWQASTLSEAYRP